LLASELFFCVDVEPGLSASILTVSAKMLLLHNYCMEGNPQRGHQDPGSEQAEVEDID
jgi:hypothetical protein